jgi:hypothetical protein
LRSFIHIGQDHTALEVVSREKRRRRSLSFFFLPDLSSEVAHEYRSTLISSKNRTQIFLQIALARTMRALSHLVDGLLLRRKDVLWHLDPRLILGQNETSC